MNRTLPLFMGMTLAGLTATAASGQPVGDPRDYVRLGEKILQLGEEFREGPELFGGIGSVAIDRAHNLFVLDRSDNSVRMFDSTGRFIGRAGGPGRGPGDLARPIRFLHDGDSLLTVIDELNGLVMFRSDEEGLHHLQTRALDFRARSGCTKATGYLLAGHLRDQSLHEVDREGHVRRSFGLPYPVISPPEVPAITDTTPSLYALANSAASLVACTPDGALVVQAQAAGPYVRGYDRNGQVLWSARVPDYNGTTYFRDRSGADIVVYGPDVSFSLLMLSARHALLQVSHRQSARRVGRVAAPRQQVRLRSIVLDVKTGRIVADGVGLPLFLLVADGVAVEVQEEPYPKVIVRERRR